MVRVRNVAASWRGRSSWRVVAALACVSMGLAAPIARAQARAAGQTPSVAKGPDLSAERALAATVSETRMVETVRALVGFGTRMYGTPSNRASAAWLADAFRSAGLTVAIRKDAPRDWYLPSKWEVRAASGSGPFAAALETAWPSSGAPSAKGDAPLALQPTAGAVCLLPAMPADNSAGCAAILVDARPSASGWPGIARLRGTWSVPVFGLSPREANPLREKVNAGEKIHVAFSLEAQRGNDSAETVVATLPGKDHSKYTLFCAHGDSDSGGPGANDNASGVAIVLEIARTAAAAIKAGKLAQPAWDMRFVAWGGEMTSTREYFASMASDPSALQAVINFDQSGFGSSKDALYVEPDDVTVNRELIDVIRGVMKDHLTDSGFPQHAATVKSQGGTDSYVFQNTRAQAPRLYPAVTLYTSAWGREEVVPLTEGYPPLNWYAGEKPGTITVDGDPYYHSAGDTPANTTDKEPFNMGWCARVGLIGAVRLMGQR